MVTKVYLTILFQLMLPLGILSIALTQVWFQEGLTYVILRGLGFMALLGYFVIMFLFLILGRWL